MATSARLDELKKKFDESPRRYFAPLANEYRKLGDLEQAIALCRTHLPQQAGHVSGHIVLAQALHEAGELAESRDRFEAALDLDPENLIALRFLGDIAREQGEPDVARTWYERVLEADPRNEEISVLLASLPAYRAPAESYEEPTADLFPADPSLDAASFVAASPRAAETVPPPPWLSSGASDGLADDVEPTIDLEPIAAEQAPSPAPVADVGELHELSFDAFSSPEPDDATPPAPAVEAVEESVTPDYVDEPMAGVADAGATRPAEPMELESFALSLDEDLKPAAPIPPPPPLIELYQQPPAAPAGEDDDWFRSDVPEQEGAGEAVAESLVIDVTGEGPSGAELSAAEVPPVAAGAEVATPEEVTPSPTVPAVDAYASGAPDLSAHDPFTWDLRAQDRSERAPAAESSEPEATPVASTFVTETMAELYLQQGFTEEALAIYRELLARQPDDRSLRNRVEALERGAPSAVVETPSSAPRLDHAGQSARAFFAHFARRQRAPRPGSDAGDHPPFPDAGESPDSRASADRHMDRFAGEAPIAASARASESAPTEPMASMASLATLFAAQSVKPGDEAAASTLAAAFGGPAAGRVHPEDGKAAGGGELSPEPFPGHVPSRSSSAVTLDEFFAGTSAPAPSPEPARITPDEQGVDIEQFTAWLEGLKKK